MPAHVPRVPRAPGCYKRQARIAVRQSNGSPRTCPVSSQGFCGCHTRGIFSSPLRPCQVGAFHLTKDAEFQESRNFSSATGNLLPHRSPSFVYNCRWTHHQRSHHTNIWGPGLAACQASLKAGARQWVWTASHGQRSQRLLSRGTSLRPV